MLQVHLPPTNFIILAAMNHIELLYFIETLEKSLGKTAEKNLLPMQAGDVEATYADIEELVIDTGYKPNTSIEVGVESFVNWYREFYHA